MTSDYSHKSKGGSFIFELGATFGGGGGGFVKKPMPKFQNIKWFKGVDIDYSENYSNIFLSKSGGGTAGSPLSPPTLFATLKTNRLS